jgi:hypothetical protein
MIKIEFKYLRIRRNADEMRNLESEIIQLLMKHIIGNVQDF